MHAYGPVPHNAWTHDDHGISLVRRERRPIPVRFDALEIDLVRSALVVVDMQNDFCHPQGWFAQKGLPIAPARQPIAALQALLPAWRAAGGQVVWLNWGIRADRRNLAPLIHHVGRRQGAGYAERSPIDRGPSLVAGTWGAQVVDELAVDARDISVHKHRLSGFWDNELDSVLRLSGTTTLLFAGVNTDRCVFSTLQDAAFLGYDCVLLQDACATGSPEYVERAIHFLVQQLHGFVATAAALRTSLPSLKDDE